MQVQLWNKSPIQKAELWWVTEGCLCVHPVALMTEAVAGATIILFLFCSNNQVEQIEIQAFSSLSDPFSQLPQS